MTYKLNFPIVFKIINPVSLRDLTLDERTPTTRGNTGEPGAVALAQQPAADPQRQEPDSKYFGLSDNLSKLLTLLLQSKSSHRQYVSGWMWLCSNKILFTKKGWPVC